MAPESSESLSSEFVDVVPNLELAPAIHMARTTDETIIDLEPDEEEVIEPSHSSGKSKIGTQAFMIDDIPPTKWARRFQEFQAWMSTKKLVKESNYEILSKFIARLTGTLKDWWTTLGETDKMHFLTQQDFSVVLGFLHMIFLGDVTAKKRLREKSLLNKMPFP